MSETAWFEGPGFIETEILRGLPADGETLAGPAVIELAETTLLVPPGASAALAGACVEIVLAESSS